MEKATIVKRMANIFQVLWNSNQSPMFCANTSISIKCLNNNDLTAKGTNIAHVIAAQVPCTTQRVQ
jgi:hypothetical protein